MRYSQVEEYSQALDEILIKTDDGLKLMPEMYAVPHNNVRMISVSYTVNFVYSITIDN